MRQCVTFAKVRFSIYRIELSHSSLPSRCRKSGSSKPHSKLVSLCIGLRLGVWGQSLGWGQPPKASDTTCTAEAPFQEEVGMGTSCFTRWPQDALADDPLHSPRSPVKPISYFQGVGDLSRISLLTDFVFQFTAPLQPRCSIGHSGSSGKHTETWTLSPPRGVTLPQLQPRRALDYMISYL